MAYDIDEPELILYRDSNGNEVPGVGYWILPRLGWEDFRDYVSLANTVTPDRVVLDDLDHVAEFLVDRAFVRYEGITKAGVALGKQDWKKAPWDLQLQMVRAIQARNTPGAQIPNSSALSKQPSEAAGRAPLNEDSSSQETLPSSNTQSESETA